MSDRYLKPEQFLPEITPQDQLFANKIVHEYDLPPDEITWLVRVVRSYLQDDFSKEMEDSRLKETFQTLFSPGTEISGITINTNNGAIKIKPYDSVFEEYFRSPLQKMRYNFKKTLNSEIDFLTSLSSKSSFVKIIFYFEGTYLNKMQTNCAIFDFIQYFKIGPPPMTKDEWIDNQTADQDYNHYKNGIIKNRKKRYLIDLNQ